jgi:hypothetical protein
MYNERAMSLLRSGATSSHFFLPSGCTPQLSARYDSYCFHLDLTRAFSMWTIALSSGRCSMNRHARSTMMAQLNKLRTTQDTVDLKHCFVSMNGIGTSHCTTCKPMSILAASISYFTLLHQCASGSHSNSEGKDLARHGAVNSRIAE